GRQRLAGECDDDTTIDRATHASRSPISFSTHDFRKSGVRFSEACAGIAATPAGDQSRLTGGGRYLGGEIGFLLLDAFTECVADKTGDFDRPTRLAFGVLQRLRHTLLVIENK